ncbi:MAG: bifunctional nuclease family protein [Candidatus Omnitrophica bacterium]|nr:bifunctional nuclease family protein [Candidatus Omnitrophota bacterium]
MELSQIRIDEKRGEQVIVLKEKNGKRLLPIVIGILEATAIKMEISGYHPPRPLTHDLLNNTIAELGAALSQIVVEKLEQNIFFAKLVIETGNGQTIEVDARPSDSIALAVRAKAPIYVARTVLDQVSFQQPES